MMEKIHFRGLLKRAISMMNYPFNDEALEQDKDEIIGFLLDKLEKWNKYET